MNRVRLVVSNVRGSCPVFSVGDVVTIEGPHLVMNETNAYCVWAAMSFTPFLLAARHGIDPKKVGLTTEGSSYRVQCLDPGPPLTPGGTVTFELMSEPSPVDEECGR